MFAEHNYKLDKETLLRRCSSGEDVCEICCFSNSAAIFRREVVLDFPFRNLPFGEDRAFVLDCVMAGHSIAYLSSAAITYQQPAGFRNFYRIGWAFDVSGHLIRELGSQAIGSDLRKSELVRRAVRLLCKPLAIIGWTLEALLCDRPHLGRAIQYAIISYAMSLGGVVGELTWERYRNTTCCDSSVLLVAQKSMNIVAPENVTYSPI